jgi:hypothetical protein
MEKDLDLTLLSYGRSDWSEPFDWKWTAEISYYVKVVFMLTNYGPGHRALIWGRFFL